MIIKGCKRETGSIPLNARCDILTGVMRFIYLPVTAAVLLGSAVSLSAEYVLVLKNGRQITVQSYREEGSMIKFQGFGGEIGISKDQLETIRNVGAEGSRGLNVFAPERPPQSESRETARETKPIPAVGSEQPPGEEEDRERDDREYLQKLSDLTERLKEAQDRYSQAVRGTTSSDPSLLTSEEQLKSRTDDIISRALDAQYKPSDPAGTKLVTPSPFSSLPPTVTEINPPSATPPFSTINLPPYTPRQKELSDLRSQALQLEREREKLIEEIKQRKIDGAGLLP